MVEIASLLMKFSPLFFGIITVVWNMTLVPPSTLSFTQPCKTQTIQNTGPQATYPAAWVPNIGQGWYLPSAGQLNVLFGALPAVNHGLSVVNGTQIVDTAGATVANGNIHFWSSTEKNANRAYALEIQDGQIGSVAKDVTASGNKQYVVRAIIDF